MNLPEPIRIISDLHLGNPGSLLTGAAQLRPLLDGIGTLICNGDAAELRTEVRRPEPRQEFDRLKTLCEHAGVRAIFINGNHDPGVSERNHLDLADGAILVTHGDLLFTDLEIGPVHRRMIQAIHDDSFMGFEARLRFLRDVIISAGLPDLDLENGPLAWFAMFAHECWPPTRPFTILRCWREASRRATTLARIFRPRARFVIIGHLHVARISSLPPQVVVDTGSFTSPLGRLAVDIIGGELIVKRIDRLRGDFFPGKEIARFPLSRLPPEPPRRLVEEEVLAWVGFGGSLR